jgi:hypothetical protein
MTTRNSSLNSDGRPSVKLILAAKLESIFFHREFAEYALRCRFPLIDYSVQVTRSVYYESRRWV